MEDLTMPRLTKRNTCNHLQAKSFVPFITQLLKMWWLRWGMTTMR